MLLIQQKMPMIASSEKREKSSLEGENAVIGVEAWTPWISPLNDKVQTGGSVVPSTSDSAILLRCRNKTSMTVRWKHDDGGSPYSMTIFGEENESRKSDVTNLTHLQAGRASGVCLSLKCEPPGMTPANAWSNPYRPSRMPCVTNTV